MAKNRTKIESEDSKGNAKVLYLIDPDAKINKQAQLAYNRAFRDALQSGAILRQKLDDVLRDQEIWDDKKEERYNSILKTLQDNEKSIKAGGIKLSDAKDLADEMSTSRNEFRSLISERTSMDSNTAEGQADNAKFNFLVYACTKDIKNQTIFSDVEDYENNSIEPFALEAARQLAEKLYGLDANYETTLPENEFLKDYGFVNDDLQRVDEDGRLISADGEHIDETGRLIEWQEDGTSIYVDGKGTKLTEDGEYDIPFSPFLDDSGDPIETPEKEEEATTEEEEATAEDEEGEEADEEVAEKVTAPKKRGRPKKQKVEDSTE
tara:strand:- start:684 stop:1649 length:966 start_codon:yes stop_codon:yes gene_type:complete